MKPLPYVVGFALFVVSVVCAARAWAALAAVSRAHRWFLFGGAVLLGCRIAVPFFGRTYEASEEWKYVGWPMAIVSLRRVTLADGRVIWHDYIWLPPLFVLVANFVFLLLVPTMPIALWSYISRWRHTPTPN